MSRLAAKLVALVMLAALGTALAAGDDKPDPIKLAKLAEWAPASGGMVSPDGKLSAVNVGGFMLLGGGNGNGNGRVYRQVKLCETATGKELAVLLGATAKCFSADGKVLCVEQGFEEPLAKAGILTPLMAMPQLWDVSNPEKPKQLFVVDGAAQESFSTDGKRLLVAGWPDQKNGNAGKVIAGLPAISKKGVVRGGANMGFGAGGGFISGSRTFEVWEVASAKFITRYEPTKNKCSLTSPVFSDDGNLVASVVTIKGSGSTISLYDMDKKKEVRRVAPGWKHSQLPDDSSQEQVQFVPSHLSPGEGPTQLLAAAIDAKATAELNLYDPTTGKLVTALHKEKQSADTMVQLQFCVSPDGKTLAVVVQRFKLGGAPLPAGGFGGFGGMGGGALPAPAPAKGQNKGQGGGFGGGGGILLPQAQNPAIAPPVGGFGGGVGGIGFFGGPGFGMPRPDTGEIIVFDLEKRAKKYNLAVVGQSARFTGNSMLAAIIFDGQATKLKLWDVATAKEIGGLDDCDQVHFAADGATMLTRCADANGMGVKVWNVERAKK